MEWNDILSKVLKEEEKEKICKIIIAPLVCYAIILFVFLDPNILEWGIHGRMTYLAMVAAYIYLTKN